jgi:hypothetical protein
VKYSIGQANYDVTFNFNGGSLLAGGSGTVTITAAGNQVVYPSRASFAKVDAAFVGWYDTSAPTNIANLAYNAAVPSSATLVAEGTAITANRTLYAAWRNGFAYTGAVEQWTVPATGSYKLEVWGAQGGHGLMDGTIKQDGGKGGYASGRLSLTSGQVLFVYVGEGLVQERQAWNGGGKGAKDIQTTTDYEGSGGGGTDIRTSKNSTYADRIIVAGGGGGSCGNIIVAGGYGGGTTGGSGIQSPNAAGPTGGTQSAGGTGASNGTLGKGGDGGVYRAPGRYFGAGGGGGWFGGGSGGSVNMQRVSGAGGSGYVGGAGLTNTEIKAGYEQFASPGGGTETGHTGHGFARITKL